MDSKNKEEYIEEEGSEPKPKKMKFSSKKLLYLTLAKLEASLEEDKISLLREEEEERKETQELLDGEKLARKELMKNQKEDALRLEEKQKTEMEEMMQNQKIERDKLKSRQKKDLEERQKVFKNTRTEITKKRANRAQLLRRQVEDTEKTLKNTEVHLITILKNEDKVKFDLKYYVKCVKQEKN